MLSTGRGRISLGPGKEMKVQAVKKTGNQGSGRTMNGQDVVGAKKTAFINGPSIEVDFMKKGFFLVLLHLYRTHERQFVKRGSFFAVSRLRSRVTGC